MSCESPRDTTRLSARACMCDSDCWYPGGSGSRANGTCAASYMASRRAARTDRCICFHRRKREMTWLRAICNGLLRALLAALIIVTGVTSAAAEAGCMVTAITGHEAPKADGTDQVVAGEEPSSEEDGQRSGSSPFHCAFSHACHGVTALAGPVIQPKRLSEATNYVAIALSPLGTTDPGNAERPPQA